MRAADSRDAAPLTEQEALQLGLAGHAGRRGVVVAVAEGRHVAENRSVALAARGARNEKKSLHGGERKTPKTKVKTHAKKKTRTERGAHV